MAFEQTIALLGTQEENHWKVGDTLVREMRAYAGANPDWGGLQAALTAAGAEHTLATMKAYYRVATKFPAEDRVPDVSFAGHQAALTIGNIASPIDVIRRAQVSAGGRATREAILSEVRQMKGRTTSQTSDAVEAWRMLRAAVDKMLDLDAAELEALLTLANGKYAGEAADLSRNLGKVSVKVADALTKAEAVMAKRAAKTKARVAGAATPKATKPKVAQATKPAPRIGRLGQNRGKG
jgi:hypothetical protein